MWHNIYQESLELKLKKMNANEITNFPKNRKPLKVSIKNALIPKYFFIKCFSSLQPLKHFLRLISNVLFIRNLTQTFQISLIQKKKKNTQKVFWIWKPFTHPYRYVTNIFWACSLYRCKQSWAWSWNLVCLLDYVICLLELCISLFLAVSKSQFPQWGSRVKRLETWSINFDKYFGPTGRQWWYGSDIRAPVTLACRKSVPIRRTDKHEITGPHRTKQYLFLSNIH